MNSTHYSDFNATIAEPQQHNNPQLLGWIISVLVTNILGGVANVLLLISLFVYRPLRRSSSWALIVHCIAIDLWMTTVSVPNATIPVYLGPHYPLSRAFCTYQNLYVYSAYVAGFYAECVLAIHRLVATVLPHHFHLLTKKSAIISIIISPWIVSVLLNIFAVLGVGMEMVRNVKSGGCSTGPTASSSVNSVLFYSVFGVYFPTGVMGVCYAVVLGKTIRDVRRKANVSRVLARKWEISRTLFLSFAWHCITIYPIYVTVGFFERAYAENLALQLTLRWLTNSFSAINPVFYWTSSRLFQDGIRKVLYCQWWRKRSNTVRPRGTRSRPQLLIS
ncbi:hypothetical protein BV898_13922 [Hypsibius exemplaris]|uniref:G-protein coupled receptors family 1 profile domain-containing protein n=1 Tax=Hypsibius exemplaris TaxID=2072580 RepID=A0A1W0W9A8_HYPEX|nr:hypothetical protein BV898_13922 [Hypsibius exemplaris]